MALIFRFLNHLLLTGYSHQIQYFPRLDNSPDLPGWLRYTYDGYNSIGYIYGVPPSHLQSTNLAVIGWNKDKPENITQVKKLILSLDIVPKDPFKYVVEMKIDNLNVKDLATPRKRDELTNIFLQQLSWSRLDGSKVVPAFMASAVALGKNRVPIKPNEAEGYYYIF